MNLKKVIFFRCKNKYVKSKLEKYGLFFENVLYEKNIPPQNSFYYLLSMQSVFIRNFFSIQIKSSKVYHKIIISACSVLLAWVSSELCTLYYKEPDLGIFVEIFDVKLVRDYFSLVCNML